MFEMQRNMSTDNINKLEINAHRMTEIIEDHVPLKLESNSPTKNNSSIQQTPSHKNVCNPQTEKVSPGLFNIITDANSKEDETALPNWNCTMASNAEVPY